MPQFIRSLTLSFWLVPLLLPAVGFGQETAGNSITATGRASLGLPAERMLLAVDLIARHQDVGEAVKLLKDRIEAAKTQVTVLGAVAESVKVGDPKISPGQSAAQQGMRARIMQGFNRAGRGEELSELRSMVTVTAPLRAQFELSDGDPVQRMAEVFALQQRIREAKLSGADDTTGLSPEEQELLEEAQMMRAQDYYSDEPQPGEPQFLFLAAVKPADHAAMLKKAFADAKSQAMQLAEAAGLQLGAVRSLKTESPVDNMAAAFDYGYSYGARGFQAGRLAEELLESDSGIPIAYGADVGALTHTVQLTAAFQILQ